MKLRRAVLAAFAAAALAGCSGAGSAQVRNDRPATEQEEHFCHESTFRGEPPASGDCSRVPLFDTIYEDDVNGRWDCRTMGNRICGSTIHVPVGDQIHAFDVNAPDRPGCFMEPSSTPQGWEIIYYSQISGRGAPEFIGDPFGFEVPCP